MRETCPICRTSYPEGTMVCPNDSSTLLPDEAFAHADETIEPGTMIGEYRVEKKLGEGSFGTVFAGIQPLIEKKVAIKLLHRRMSSEPEIVARFIDEARAVNRIGHRNIIDIFSFGVHTAGQHYFVMEFCEGTTLGALLDQKERLDITEALPILRGIADGLDAAHEAGVTHRDLKPDNVFLLSQKDGSHAPKLLDFGVAKLVREDGAAQTATGVAIGTPRYMSPEQCRGKKVDHRTDIYALGCVIHEMLTGKPVFEADSTVDLLFKHTTEKPPSMSSVCPSVPPELDGLVLAMLAKRPNARPSSAGAAIAAIEEAVCMFARTPPVPAPAPAAGEPPQSIPETLVPEGQAVDPMGETIATNAPAEQRTEIATVEVPKQPAAATVVGAPLSEAVEAKAATGITAAATLEPPRRPAHLEKPSKIGWIAGGAAIALLGTAGVLGWGRWRNDAQQSTNPGPPPIATQAIAPEPSAVTLRVAVMPPDSRVVVDGRDMGGAGDSIVLPREKKRHAVRIERQGYEPQLLWILADADQELGPISLTALATPPAVSAPAEQRALPASQPATKKSGLHKDLWKPEELGGPK